MRIWKPALNCEQADCHRRRALAVVYGFSAALLVSLTGSQTVWAATDTMSAQEIMQRKDVGVAVITVFDPRPGQKSALSSVSQPEAVNPCPPKVKK